MNTDIVRAETAAKFRNVVKNHRHVVRGGERWFPKKYATTMPPRQTSLYADLTEARGDGLAFSADARHRKSPASMVHLVQSLPYGEQQLGEDRFEYRRLVAVFAGRSMRGDIIAICRVADSGTSQTTDDGTPYRLDKGVLFTADTISTFSRQGGRITQEANDGNPAGWIDAFLDEELNIMSRNLLPELDGVAITPGGVVTNGMRSIFTQASTAGDS